MSSKVPAIADLRTLVRDPSTPSSYNLVRGETPKQPAGTDFTTAKVFYLSNTPIVASSVFITTTSANRTQVGFTVDVVNGILTFTSAPNSTIFLADYNFNYFADADYQAFLDEGSRFVGQAAGIAIDELLLPATYEFAKAKFYDARASQYADRYKSSGGQMGQDVDIVTTNMRQLAVKSYADSQKLRDDYYTRQSSQKKAVAHSLNYGIGSPQPRR